MHIKQLFSCIFRRRARESFLSKLTSNVRILDVGCGNDSAFYTKKILPNCTYIGIDVMDFNNSQSGFADKYIISTPDMFYVDILNSTPPLFDCVISSHNLEHCKDPMLVLIAMTTVLSKGGKLYLSFPSENTTQFPSRFGVLNFYDDPTHQKNPPNFHEVLDTLKNNGMDIRYSFSQYSPSILRFLGFLNEIIPYPTKKVRLGTWEFWGFESIIWAVKL